MDTITLASLPGNKSIIVSCEPDKALGIIDTKIVSDHMSVHLGMSRNLQALRQALQFPELSSIWFLYEYNYSYSYPVILASQGAKDKTLTITLMYTRI